MDSKQLEIIALADFHSLFDQFAPVAGRADVAVVAGDLLGAWNGDLGENLIDQRNRLPELSDYLLELPVDKVLVAPGNHDYLFELLGEDIVNDQLNAGSRPGHRPVSFAEKSTTRAATEAWDRGELAEKPASYEKITYLEQGSYSYRGVQFWLSGLIPATNSTPRAKKAFRAQTNAEFVDQFHIPTETDVVVAHFPPELDEDHYLSFPDDSDIGDHIRAEIDRVHPSDYVGAHFHDYRGEWSVGKTRVHIASNTLWLPDRNFHVPEDWASNPPELRFRVDLAD